MASSSVRSEDCTRLLFEAVSENSVSKLKQVKSTYNRNELLASLAQCNEKNETPLGIAMKRKNVELIDELMKFLHRFHKSDNYRLVPSAIDQLSHQIPVMELIDHLIEGIDYSIDRLNFMAQVFIESTSFTRQNKIVALELIGASLIFLQTRDSHVIMYDDASFLVGLQCWREAMTLRYFPAEGEPPLPKIPIVLVPSEACSVVFESVVEVVSMEELNLLEEYLSNDIYSAVFDMQLQSLIVIRRTCYQANHSHPYRLYLKSLYEFALSMIDMMKGDIDESLDHNVDNKILINTFLLILEQMAGCDPKMLCRKSFDIFIDTLREMSSCFIEMLREPADSPGSKQLSYGNLLAPTKFIGMIANFFPNSAIIPSIPIVSNFTEPCEFAELVFRFVLVLESISSQLSSQEKQQLEEYYSHYFRNFFPERTTTVLHAAVRDRNEILQNDEKIKIVRRILQLGADPNSTNESGETPLHISSEITTLHLDENLPVFQALVNAGGHLCIADENGDTVLSLLKNNLMRYKRGRLIVDPYYESLINDVFPLSCYCARVIRRHEIPFDEERLPLRLQTFVSRHSAKEDSSDLHQHEIVYEAIFELSHLGI